MRKILPYSTVIALLLVAVAGCDSTSGHADPVPEASSSSSTAPDLTQEEQALVAKVREEGSVMVIARVTAEDETEIAEQLGRLETELAEYDVTDADTGTDWLAATVTEDALNFLLGSPDVDQVWENGVKTTQ